MSETCETCRFWNVDEAQSSVIAECRRNAPQPADNMVSPAWWAFTKREQWCGEHQPRKETQQ